MSDWLRGLPGRVADNALGGLLAVAVLGGAPLALALLVGDVKLPGWLLAAVVALVGLGAYIAGRRQRTTDSDVQALLEYLDTEVGLTRYYAAHLNEILEIVQRALAGQLPVTFGDFIDHGVLQPARDLLTYEDEIRISVLVPDGEERNFTMAFAAGHSLASLQQFSLPIADSFSGLTFTRGEIHWSNDVDADPRYRPHPRARQGREYGSLASVPIKVGDKTVAVLNVISTRQQAFSPSDLTYVVLLGSVLSVVWSLMETHDGNDVPAVE